MNGFVEAFNRGDQARLATFIPEESVGFFTTGLRENQETALQGIAENREDGTSWGADSHDELLRVLQERHSQREQWQLLRLQVASLNNRSAMIQFRLTASAKDLSERNFEGRGLVNCQKGWITTWIMADSPGVLSATPVATP